MYTCLQIKVELQGDDESRTGGGTHFIQRCASNSIAM